MSRSDGSRARVRLMFQVSSFGSCLHFTFRGSGGAVGARTPHFYVFRGCGKPDISLKVRNYVARRFKDLKVQEPSSVHVGLEVPRATDFSAQSIPEVSRRRLNPFRPHRLYGRLDNGPFPLKKSTFASAS